jgi:hypothetical protein
MCPVPHTPIYMPWLLHLDPLRLPSSPVPSEGTPWDEASVARRPAHTRWGEAPDWDRFFAGGGTISAGGIREGPRGRNPGGFQRCTSGSWLGAGGRHRYNDPGIDQ